jgi:hypothetical protein
MRRLCWLGLGFAASGALAGCAEGANDRPDYTTGIDAQDQSVASLDEMQLERVCESYDVYVETYVDFDTIAYVACLPAALVLSPTRELCESALERCMSVFPKPIQVSGTVRSQEVCAEDLQQCNATVAELESCVNVNLNDFIGVSDWSCDLIGDAQAVSMARESMDSVRVCADLDDACNRFSMVQVPQ